MRLCTETNCLWESFSSISNSPSEKFVLAACLGKMCLAVAAGILTTCFLSPVTFDAPQASTQSFPRNYWRRGEGRTPKRWILYSQGSLYWSARRVTSAARKPTVINRIIIISNQTWNRLPMHVLEPLVCGHFKTFLQPRDPLPQHTPQKSTHLFAYGSQRDAPNALTFSAINNSPVHGVSTKAQPPRPIC